MFRIIHPSGIVKERIQLPSSKSISNRALVIQYLSDLNQHIENLSTANDTILLKEIIETNLPTIDVQDAGTAFRFLTAALCVKGGTHILTGSERLRQRPIAPLVSALQSLGAKISYVEKDGYAPLRIEGGFCEGGEVEIDASVSSQFISALLMIAPILKKGLTIKLKSEVTSIPYIRMTLSLMQHFDVHHEWSGNKISVAHQQYKPNRLVVEADWSSASYWYQMVACAKEAELFLYGLHFESLQGDAVVTEIMKQIGVQSDFSEDGVRLSRINSFELPDQLEYNCRTCPDLVPALVATCCALNIKATFTDVGNLDLKESKRLNVLTEEFTRNGISIVQEKDTIHLKGGKLLPQCNFNVHNDHRMAMSFAPLALVTQSVTLDEVNPVKKSYPQYWEHLKLAGFVIDET